jgi:hypothetical protein
VAKLDDEQRAEIRALLKHGLSSAEIATRLRVPIMRVAAVRAHMTMGTYDQVRTPRVRTGVEPRDAEVLGLAVGADALGGAEVASVGIDVAESKRGLDLVGLDRERQVVVSRGRLSVGDVVALTIALQPKVVCIDSPSAGPRPDAVAWVRAVVATLV